MRRSLYSGDVTKQAVPGLRQADQARTTPMCGVSITVETTSKVGLEGVSSDGIAGRLGYVLRQLCEPADAEATGTSQNSGAGGYSAGTACHSSRVFTGVDSIMYQRCTQCRHS